ncbi:MAG: IS200/IS605 family transposase [Phycisphaerae bacterium]|nr:IS200/IS605 family transposase [Phycisphaerae bacterium]
MGHSYTALYYHIVFSTKNRTPQITSEFHTRLYDYIGGIVKGENGTLLAAGGMPDHVHLLVAFHATECVADMLRRIKTNSSKWIHETRPDKRHFAWQPGYGAFTVSRSNLDQVQAYIENQKTHHAHLSFEEEFISFLKRHGVPYDEKYIWG